METSEGEWIFVGNLAVSLGRSQNQPEHRNYAKDSPEDQPSINRIMTNTYLALLLARGFRGCWRLLFEIDAHAVAASRFLASFSNFFGLLKFTSSNISVLKITINAPIRLGTSNMSESAEASPKFPLSKASE